MPNTGSRRASRGRLLVPALAGVLFGLLACDSTPLATGLPDGEPTEPGCSLCHGSAANAAPPSSLDALAEPAEIAVGAHQAHVRDSETREAIACEECHPVPETVDEAGHMDPAPAELSFGALATTGDLHPIWERREARCANTYCHGTGATGGRHPEPIWTRVDRTQVGCSGCHGSPPPPPHPALSNCWDCHRGVVDETGRIEIEGALHLNGEVDTTVACNDCHGTTVDGAPPPALDGSVATTAIAVGAHDAHLHDGELREAIECEECHTVPHEVGDPGHLYSLRPAEVTFGPLAMTGGAFPVWQRDATAPACSNVYCHGAVLGGGENNEPIWTQVDGSQAQCGNCHSLPPPAPHPGVDTCEICHAETVVVSGDDPTIDVNGRRHINGVVDIPEDCNGCHGDSTGAAPPRALDGATATTAVGVGAHRSHVTDGPLRRALSCDVCHAVPLEVLSPGHLDTAPAEVLFSGLATARGETPVWDDDPVALTCASVYCHGASLGGGTVPAPVWTQVDGTQAGCGSCHGLPPPAPHPPAADCAVCHPQTVIGGTDPLEIDLSTGTHIDGEVSFF